MKRFLVTLVVIILAVSVGFGVFYLVKDNEVISLKAHTIYKDAGESFEVNLDMENPNSYTTVTVSSSDENVVKVEGSNIDKKNGVATGTFTAVGGGSAKIVFKTNNAKFRNIGCDIIVCDGSLAYPYRIDTAEELQRIGSADETIYTTDKCYVLTDNIDLGSLDNAFQPLPSLSGSFDGNGYTVSNLKIADCSAENVGLFQEVATTGVVKNLKLENVTIEANNQNKQIGTITGVNKGKITLCEVKSATITGSTTSSYVGGIAGVNQSTNQKNSRSVARIDRVSANVILGTSENRILGTIGGITGHNHGGIVINSYTKGTAHNELYNNYGGIVGKNEYLAISGSGTGYDGDLGANIKDCYSIINMPRESANYTGRILAKNVDHDGVNKIVGNYYESDNTMKGIGNKDITYGSGDTKQNGTTNALSDNILKNLSKLVSYKYYDKKVVIGTDGTVKFEPDLTTEKVYYWNLSVWKIDLTQNDGYPILTFNDVYVDDNFDGEESATAVTGLEVFNLMRNNLGGTYVLNQDIDLSTAGEWVPIGTKEKPFTGKLLIVSGVDTVTLSGLTIEGTDYDYAGLFGVLGDGAYVSGITLKDVKIKGQQGYAGAIAGQNNGTIEKCVVANGDIDARYGAGGIVGENKGKICNVDVNGENGKLLTITKLVVSGSSNFGAGGIAGINYNTISASDSNGNKVRGNVMITAKGYTSIGGAVGQNNGTISGTYVVLSGNDASSTKYGVVINGTANVGGIAGYSVGTVSTCYVSATLSADASKENSIVGGIVGSLNATSNHAVKDCVVENSYINGYYVGGVVALVNTQFACKLDISKETFDFNGAQYPSNINANTEAVVENAGVESTVTLEGKYSGGLICVLTKGVVKNCYTKAGLSADNNAGIVWSILYSNSTKEGGVIYKVYSVASHKQGSSYAVSSSEVHNNWNVGWIVGESAKNRTVGFIFDYYYESNSNLKDPKVPNPLKGIYEMINKTESVNNGRSLSELKTKSLWDNMFSNTVWTCKDGALPTINTCEVVKNNQESLYN